MELSDFDYNLPPELIAQYPLPRGTSRLMVVDRSGGRIEHAAFADLGSSLKAGDCLVINDTRVIPARLKGVKDSGGKVELLLVKELEPGGWECLAKASKPLWQGATIRFEEGLMATVIGAGDGLCQVQFNQPELLGQVGEVPLPPYIERAPEQGDSETYQTVYARHDGSVAAPTAGLHFDQDMLGRLRGLGVEIVPITLHVGPGTFVPVRTSNIHEHRMHTEEYRVSPDAAAAINRAREAGRRVMAVGTTTTRVLEHLMRAQGTITAGPGATDIFITPGFEFRCIQGLITNFHLPCSTLIMLVAAFGGHALTMRAYAEAVKERYRFFSYGDAMLIV